MIEYFVIALALFGIAFLYFRLANHYNIIDKPNERSSHTLITLRGGGIIFYFGILFYFFLSGFNYPWFFVGLTLICLISFLDDIYSISNRIRVSIHFVAALFILLQTGFFEFPLAIILISLILIIGTLNAFNFMDGINGITASYTFAVLLLLLLANMQGHFIDSSLIYFTMIANGVFTFFNFRKKATCFAGDIGSMGIAFILIFLNLALIIQSGSLIYILFFVVYGVDTVWTIIERLIRKENIFVAHRTHLYQFLSNEAGYNKLFIAFIYGFIQFLIGYMTLRVASKSGDVQLWYSIGMIIVLSFAYFFIKKMVTTKFVLKEKG